MPTRCTAATGEIIVPGDAVCLANATPDQVRKAVPAALANAPTVLGVARQVLPNGDVLVNTIGEVVESAITGLGPGTSNLIAVDANAKLVRVPKPDGSEYVVGTCDAQGHTCIQARASRDVSPKHVFNVKNYGAKGDCTNNDPTTGTDDWPAVLATMQAATTYTLGSSKGAIIYFPPLAAGKSYRFSRFDIEAPLEITGAHSAFQEHATQITLEPGAMVRTYKFTAAPRGGDAQGAKFRNLHVVATSPDEVVTWSPNLYVTAGQIVRLTKTRAFCLKVLKSGHLAATEPDYFRTGPTNPDYASFYAAGEIIYYGAIRRSNDLNHLDVHFRVLALALNTPAVTGAEPAWDYTPGKVTTGTDGIAWTCQRTLQGAVDSQGALDGAHTTIVEGTATLSNYVHSALWIASGRMMVEDVAITGTTLNASIAIIGNLSSATRNRRLAVVACTRERTERAGRHLREGRRRKRGHGRALHLYRSWIRGLSGRSRNS